ncbi:MAG: periplasmic heavy metal sensor [Rhizobiales bacterium]|nr:periplasmic heavy metal sensor [Hyphomicrobiales bacterium]MBI3674551.1 periplasmic heavy metal sensor [Hyphomicrobiales bacterium]
MSETVSPAESSGKKPPSGRRWSWWNLLLVVSLALNLLVAGAAVARFYFPPSPERMASLSYLQLIPRRFMLDVDRQRRETLLALLRDYRDRFRAGQQSSRAAAASLADALEAQPYDETKVRAVVDGFVRNGTDLLALGSQAAMEFIAKLTPEERADLARRIRERAGPAGRK